VDESAVAQRRQIRPHPQGHVHRAVPRDLLAPPMQHARPRPAGPASARPGTTATRARPVVGEGELLRSARHGHRLGAMFCSSRVGDRPRTRGRLGVGADAVRLMPGGGWRGGALAHSFLTSHLRRSQRRRTPAGFAVAEIAFVVLPSLPLRLRIEPGGAREGLEGKEEVSRPMDFAGCLAAHSRRVEGVPAPGALGFTRA